MRRREEAYVCVEREIVAGACVSECVSSLRPLWDEASTGALVGNAFLVFIIFLMFFYYN